MLTINASDLKSLLDYNELCDALTLSFINPPRQPERHHHNINVPKDKKGTLLLMPAWHEGSYLGVKTVTIYPDNSSASPPIPAVIGSYLLMDATTGKQLALIDGTELTLRRTASTSALAAKHLANKDAKNLLMVGSGAVARHLVRAYKSIRPITNVTVWSRNNANADILALEIETETKLIASVTDDLKEACQNADIISCATLSTKPLIRGRWLKPGVHLDLVGAFTPKMQECDVSAIARSRLFVDTYHGVLKEGGEVFQAIKAGVISKQNITGELREVLTQTVVGRKKPEDITCFKSVGAALEDLAAAKLAYEKYIN